MIESARPRKASAAPSGGPSLRATRWQHGASQFRDRLQRRPRRLTMRRMSGPGNNRHFHRAIAFLLRDLDLADRPILVVGALDEGDGNADIGEIVRDIPAA